LRDKSTDNESLKKVEITNSAIENFFAENAMLFF